MARIKRVALFAMIAVVLASLVAPASALVTTIDPSPPTSPVKLIFIHHSTGESWLANGLAVGLRDADYFVSDTNYGWGPDAIGDHTDIGDWWTWFRGPNADVYTAALYGEYQQHASYARIATDPGGSNQIVMLKSCFPNSDVGGTPADAIPPIGTNPLRGAGTSDLTVGNAKGIYLDFLEYAKLHPEKLFVLVVSPPLRQVDTNATNAANARALANWLVDPGGWLADYPAHNVVAFDYYTVLTGGHHRVVAGAIEHTAGPTNYLAYPTGDSHPSAGGHAIAAAEFVPLLNAAYHSWRGDATASPSPTTTHRLSRSPTGASYVIVRHRGSAGFTYSATLETSAGVGIPGRTILLQKSADGATFTTVRGVSMVASANGAVTVRLVFKTAGTGIWRWLFAGDSEYYATSTSKTRITVR